MQTTTDVSYIERFWNEEAKGGVRANWRSVFN